MPLTAKERQQRWRERQKANTTTHEQYKQAERMHYVKHKQTGSRKLACQMGEREHRAQRRRWRSQQHECRARQQIPAPLSLSPNRSVLTGNGDNGATQSNSVKSNSASAVGRKKVRKDRAKAYRTIQSLKGGSGEA